MSPFTPWQQPQSMPTQQPQPLSPYSVPQLQPMPAPAADPMARVMPFIQQAGTFLAHLTAGQLAILFVMAGVGKRTNSRPYVPAADEQPDMQILRQLHAVASHGAGYTLTPMGDALIVAERLTRMLALA